MFSSAFSGAFAGRGVPVAGYIAPCMAQAALAAGASWSVSGSALVVAGKRLIGPAGKIYSFVSVETAEKWAINAGVIGLRESQLMATLDPVTAAAWKAKKRLKLAVVASRLVAAAAKQMDSAKRAALVAESDYCLSKWG